MGYWFGKFDSKAPWRKTPAKINDNWYTPAGERVRDSRKYFGTIKQNGEYWKGKTGWKK